MVHKPGTLPRGELGRGLKEKVGLICCGARASPITKEIYRLQHPTGQRRTGNAGLHLVLDGGWPVNVLVGEPHTEKSPYTLSKSHILKRGEPVCSYTQVPAPKWYAKKTSDGTLMANVLMQEGKDTLIAAAWNECVYHQSGVPCKFCGLAQDGTVKKPGQIAETVLAALQEKPSSVLHLTGGNTASRDRGARRYLEYVEAVRRVSGVPVTIELSPPGPGWLEKLVDAGVAGFSINIEVWDEKKRRTICPGKSTITKKEYDAAWRDGARLLGDFKVSSVLIVGLDSVESIKNGIGELVSLKVKPVLIPFKPMRGSALEAELPPTPEQVTELSVYAAEAMRNAGARACEMVGCERCGACTVEKDFLEMMGC